MVYYYEVKCLAEKLVHYLQCHDHCKGLYNQNTTISTISSELLVCLQPNSWFDSRLDNGMPLNVRDCAIVEGEPEEIRQGQWQFLCNCTKEAAGDVIWTSCLGTGSASPGVSGCHLWWRWCLDVRIWAVSQIRHIGQVFCSVDWAELLIENVGLGCWVTVDKTGFLQWSHSWRITFLVFDVLPHLLDVAIFKNHVCYVVVVGCSACFPCFHL